MIKLMNSAMMPSPDFIYRPRRLTREEFAQAVRAAYESGAFENYIGYASTVDHIAKISGVSVQVSREQTRVDAGDVMLVCKLRYRVDPSAKGNQAAQADINDDDFEYWQIEVLPYNCLAENSSYVRGIS